MSHDNGTTHHKHNRAAAAFVTLAAITLGIFVSHSLTSQPFGDDAHRRLSLIDEDQTLPGIFPLRWPQDYLGFGCAILGLLLAAGGGIGGGGILVPIYILLLEFPVKHAIPLASTTVLGGAIANNMLNVRKVHPDHPERPLIDWDLVLQLEPMTIAGALIGADLNKEIPDVVLVVLMLLLLTVTAFVTLKKACKMYHQEEEELAFQNTEICVSPKGTSLAETDHFEMDDIESISKCNLDTKSSLDSFRRAIKCQCITDALKLVGLFVTVTSFDLLKGTPEGGGGGPTGLSACGTECFWISEILMFVVIFLFSLLVRSSILERVKCGGPVLSDIQWDEKNTLLYPTLSILSGLVAGMFGIGGGIVKGPLMIALGVHPKVAAATSACMILFTSSTSTLNYLIFGYLKYDYAAFCLLLGFFSTLVGQTMMTALLESSGHRNSYIAFCIGAVVAVSAVAMGIESVVAILAD